MKILFFIPYNQSAPYIESTIKALYENRETVVLLTTEKHGQLHKNLSDYAIETYSLNLARKNKLQFFLGRVFKLAQFCREHKIDIVYSHYQEANIISVFAQYLCKSKFVLTRHHSDCAYVDNNRSEQIADLVINKLTRLQLVPSPKVYNQVVDIEKCNPNKVKLVNYGYDFSNVPQPNQELVSQIRNEYKCQVLIVSAARLIHEKRHELLIQSVNSLIGNGHDIKLLILGKGPLEDQLKKLVITLKLQDYVFLPGFKINIHDYFAAADLVAHFSISEASNSAIKEAALQMTPIAVCQGVGDFDEYFEHLKNGFLLDKERPDISLISLFPKIINGHYDLIKMSELLKLDVLNRFDIKEIIGFYRSLHDTLNAK